MPLYHLKLVDSRIVSDHGVHDLPDETVAQIEAIRLARSLQQESWAGLRVNADIVEIMIAQARLDHEAIRHYMSELRLGVQCCRVGDQSVRPECRSALPAVP
jgi:hypothetical protein